MIRRPPRSTRTDTLFPTRRSSDLTLSFDTNGRTMMGVTPAQLAELAHALQPPPLAFGGNCGTGASELMAAILNLESAKVEGDVLRSEEHTSELQSLMRISSAVFCLKKKKNE